VHIVVCGAQKPFVRGGAEQHQDALAAALRSAGHEADVVRLPVAWEKGRLLDAPLAWRLLPIDADLVIATNFPSYFVRHPRKVVWLLHQHRGAYDAADAAWSDFGPDGDAWETQRILTEWDNRALAEARHVFTNSSVVSDRLRAHNGLEGTPLSHPAPLTDRLAPGPFGDYVLFVSRLEANKRPQLAVEALSRSQSGLRLVIAGTGTLAGELTELIARLGLQDRVELAGWVEDDRLLELYANALTVLYAPHDEDYGYVTLQAFAAGKPVITARDAGAVLDFVVDGQTGLVTDGSPARLAAAIDRLAGDRAEAARLGNAGRESVAGLRWAEVVDRLLAP
jgi:glycosyltransferase involved in cell wall biosynthesis